MAMRMLREGENSITEIALRLGYQDPANFTRAFRTRTGVSPLSYRYGCNGETPVHNV